MSSPEFDLIRLAARAVLDERRALALREAVDAGVDWPRAFRLASYHRLSGLLYAHLRSHTAAPEAAVGALHNHVRQAAFQVLSLTADMARIARRFDAAELPYLVLKGPSLAEVYGGVARRPYVDNDLLIRRADFGRTEQALLELGFEQHKRSAAQQAGYLRVHGEYTFRRPPGAARSTVDVHTAVVPAGFSYAPRFGDLRRRARWIDVAGVEVPVLGWEDLFLTLSVNALKDQWGRLRLASDLAEVAARVGDWDAVADAARRSGCLRAMHLAVLVAADEVDGQFPAAVLQRARRDGRARALAEQVRAALATSDEVREMSVRDRMRLTLLAQDGVKGQIRYAAFAAARRATERWVAPGS